MWSSANRSAIFSASVEEKRGALEYEYFRSSFSRRNQKILPFFPGNVRYDLPLLKLATCSPGLSLGMEDEIPKTQAYSTVIARN
jgi:hypothetical protein